jgi:hypothetical protein
MFEYFWQDEMKGCSVAISPGGYGSVSDILACPSASGIAQAPFMAGVRHRYRKEMQFHEQYGGKSRFRHRAPGAGQPAGPGQ